MEGFKVFTSKFSKLSLKIKVIVLIVAVVILPATGVLFFLSISSSRITSEVESKSLEETISLVKQDLLNSVVTKAQIFDLTFKNIIIDLEVLKQSILENGFDQKILSDFYYKHQLVSSIYFINSQNSIFLLPSSNILGQGTIINLSDKKEFDFLKSGEKSFVGRWIGPYQDFKSQNKIISYLLPAWKQSEFFGIVGFDLTIDSLFNEIIHLDPSQSSYVFIVRSSGEVISYSETFYKDFKIDKVENPNLFDSRIIKEQGISDVFSQDNKKEGLFSISGEKEQDEKIATFSNISSFGGKLVLVSPLGEVILIQKEKASEIQRTLARINTIRTLSMVILGIFLVVCSFYLVRKGLIKPIIIFRNAAKNISEGKLNSRAEIKSKDEIGELAVAFNEMASKLSVYTHGLETQVSERTTELSQKLKELKESNANLERIKQVMISLVEDAQKAERKAEKEGQQSKAIIASMGDALVEIDKESKIVAANSAAMKLLELSKEELLNQRVIGVITVFKEDKEVPTAENPILKVLQVKEAISADLTQGYFFKNTKGRNFPVAFSITPLLLFGDPIGAVAVFRDISEIKNLEDARINFISVASHQLRTPLTSMRWFSEMLLSGDAGKITAEQKHFVERIYQATDRMIALVDVLLQIARVEAGRLKIEPVPIDFKSTIRGLTVSLKTLLDAKSQIIEVHSTPDPFPAVPLDQDVIWQVLQNLLTNAIRYSPAKSKITITITQKDKVAEFAVKDQGIGIPKDQQNRIFEKFFRAENALKMVPEGSGLGLSLVKSLVEGWGGKIWFESEEGKGATFFFTVPLMGAMPKEGEVKLAV